MLSEAGLRFRRYDAVDREDRLSHPHGRQTAEAETLRRLLMAVEIERDVCRNEIEEYKRKLKKTRTRADETQEPQTFTCDG